MEEEGRDRLSRRSPFRRKPVFSVVLHFPCLSRPREISSPSFPPLSDADRVRFLEPKKIRGPWNSGDRPPNSFHRMGRGIFVRIDLLSLRPRPTPPPPQSEIYRKSAYCVLSVIPPFLEALAIRYRPAPFPRSKHFAEPRGRRGILRRRGAEETREHLKLPVRGETRVPTVRWFGGACLRKRIATGRYSFLTRWQPRARGGRFPTQCATGCFCGLKVSFYPALLESGGIRGNSPSHMGANA